MQPRQKQVIIAGAGISGLACAQKLIEQGFLVTILEASNRYGGRIKPLLDFLPQNFEAGGQEIHYRHTPYYQMAIKSGALLKTDRDLEDYVWDPYQKKMITHEKLETKYKQVGNIFNHFEKLYKHNGQDMSVLERIKIDGFDMNFLHYYESIFGGEYGSTLDSISAKGVGLCEDTFPSNVENFCFTNIHHKDILDKNYHEVYPFIQYNCPIYEVNLKDQGVFIKYKQDSQTIEIFADYFVCAIPVTQVKKLKWNPPFDEQRQKQLDHVKMGQGGKLFIQIDNPINLKDAGLLTIKSKPNLILWNQTIDESYVLAALVTETGNKEIQEKGLQKYVEEICQDLNVQVVIKQQYKIKLNNNYKVLQFKYQDWGKEEFIEGMYSYPLPGIALNYRKIIGAPIENKIFFCGEAYHKIFWATIHGALETGIEASKQIIKINSI